MDTPRETHDIISSTDQYAQRFTGPIGTWLLNKQWLAVHQMLKTCPGRSVLDVGGGHAQLTGRLLEHGYNTTILGSNPACARRVAPFFQPDRCAFHVGDLLNLPYQDQSFDTVIALRLMAHLKDWPRFLSELTRVARHAVILDYPSLVSINRAERLLFSLKKAIEGNTRHYQCFTTKIIGDTCTPHNFTPDGRQRQFFCPMVVHRSLKMPKLSAAIESVCQTLGLTHALGSPVVLKLSRINKPPAPLAAITHHHEDAA